MSGPGDSFIVYIPFQLNLVLLESPSLFARPNVIIVLEWSLFPYLPLNNISISSVDNTIGISNVKVRKIITQVWNSSSNMVCWLKVKPRALLLTAKHVGELYSICYWITCKRNNEIMIHCVFYECRDFDINSDILQRMNAETLT